MGCEVYREASLWNALLILFIQDFHSPLDKLLLCPTPILTPSLPNPRLCRQETKAGDLETGSFVSGAIPVVIPVRIPSSHRVEDR